MGYKFNPFSGKLDSTGPEVTALNTLGVKADLATIQAIVGPSVGDVWQADDTDIFYLWDGSAWVSLGTLGTAGPTGATGPTGPAGADGSTILSGSGAPVDNVTGSDGDFYIDTAAHTIYGPRTAGAWGVGTSLVAGGATTLGGLTDVNLVTTPPTDGQALVYDNASGDWIPGSAGATAAGSANEIQYNDGASGLAASADLTWDNTAKELGVGGDLNLDSGGALTTTIQSVTPTANRTISFPDQTGTVGLVSGATGNIQYNNAGQLAGTNDLNTELDWVSPTGTYTALKVNADSNGGNTGTLLDLQVDGTSKLGVRSDGYFTLPSNDFILYAADNATRRIVYNATGLAINKSQGFVWSANTYPNDVGGPITAGVFVDDANILAQRNGTNAQTYRLYNTYTDDNNYQRTSITDDSTGLIIDQQYATDGGGPGAVRTNLLDLKDNGTTKLKFDKFGINYGVASAITTYIGLGGTFGAVSGFRLYGDTTTLRFASNHIVGWTANAVESFTTLDTALIRDSAGVVAVTDGSTGTGYLKQTPVPFATINAITLSAGIRGLISDSNVAAAGNFGAVVNGTNTGTGNNVVPVYYDGTQWLIG
jgi:hypothetical protein